MTTHHKDPAIGGVIGFFFSIIRSLQTHIDWWAVLQSIICAVGGFLAVKLTTLIYRYFRKKLYEN
jgi:hypothetical protein